MQTDRPWERHVTVHCSAAYSNSVGQELKDLLHHVTARAFVALAATEVAAHSTNSPVYLMSWQTAIPSASYLYSVYF